MILLLILIAVMAGYSFWKGRTWQGVVWFGFLVLVLVSQERLHQVIQSLPR